MKLIVFSCTILCFMTITYAQPSNNTCSNAIPLCPGSTLNGTTTGATSDGTTDYNFCFTPSSTVWYKFTTGNTGGMVTIDFSNLVFNSNPSMGQSIDAHMISATTPCSLPTYTPVSACGTGSTNFSIVSAVGLNPNTTYYVQVNGTNQGAGVTQSAQCDFDISITGDIVFYSQEFIDVCYGSDYTYPDGTVETTITSDVTHVSNLNSMSTGCDSLVETNLNAMPQVNVVATQVGVTFTANSIVGSYQWVDCDDNFSHISGETNQSYTATQNGHYACIVTENACSDTTTCFEADFTSLSENNLFDFEIYPNPSSGEFRISFSDKSISEFQIKIISVQGTTVFHSNFENSENMKLNLPIGVYLVELTELEYGKNEVKKLIVQ